MIPVRPVVRLSAAALNSEIARRRTRRVLVAPGVSASLSGIHFISSNVMTNASSTIDNSNSSRSRWLGSAQPWTRVNIPPSNHGANANNANAVNATRIA